MFASMFWALCKLHHLEPFQSHISLFFLSLVYYSAASPLLTVDFVSKVTSNSESYKKSKWTKKVSDYQPLRKSKHLIKQMLGNICKIRLKWAVLIWDKRAKRGWVIFIPQKASSHQAYLIRPCCFVLKAALLETVSNTSRVSSGESAHICNC